MKLIEGVPCNHTGCLNHVTHPCEECGRIAGRTVKTNEITECLLPLEVRAEFLEATKDYSLPCKRYVLKYRGKEHYVVISTHNNRPVEIFISTILEQDHNTATGITALTRFISMTLKAYELNEVVSQLNKSSLSHHDLPGLLAKLLNGDHIIL